jgi:hypothetical protein
MKFLPADAAPFVEEALSGTPPAGMRRARALALLLPAYASGRRLAAGAGAWLGGVVAAVTVPTGLALLVGATLLGTGTGDALAGLVMVMVGAVAAGLGGRTARPVLAAGSTLSRAAAAWLRAGPAPSSARDIAPGAISPLRPEVFPRHVAGALAALLAVVAASMSGLAVGQVVDAGSDQARLLSGALVVAFALAAAVCGVAAVTTLRGALRVTRALGVRPR